MKNLTKTVRSGRIQFSNIPIEPDPPKDLVCEECETEYSVSYCSRCDQVFCPRCVDLCHPKGFNDSLHSHVADKVIRPIKFGDKSKIKIEKKFYLPDQEFFEDDYLKVKDLSKPFSLSAARPLSNLSSIDDSNKNPDIVTPSKKFYVDKPKYDVNQIVLFKDPENSRNSYGLIISQWDFRSSGVSPAIVRGNDSLVYYYVLKYGLFEEIENVREIVDNSKKKQEESHKKLDWLKDMMNKETDLFGANSIPNREHLYFAQKLNKRIAEMRNIKKLGPKYHMRRLNDPDNHKERKIRLLPPRPEDLFELDSMSSSSSIRDPGRVNENMQPPNSSGSQQGHHNQVGLPRRHGQVIQTNNNHPDPISGQIRSALDGVDVNLYADIDDDIQSQMSFDNQELHPLPASRRSYEHFIYNNMEQESLPDQEPLDATTNNMMAKLSIGGVAGKKRSTQSSGGILSKFSSHSDISKTAYLDFVNSFASQGNQGVDPKVQKGLKVLLLSELELVLLEEYIERFRAQKSMFLMSMLERQFFSGQKLMLFDKFMKWRKNTRVTTRMLHNMKALVIQTRARVWLCRNKLQERIDEWHAYLEEKRRSLHAQFRYVKDPKEAKYQTFTWNQQLYFETRADLNRYAAFLRFIMIRVLRYLTKRKLFLYMQVFSAWKLAATDFNESNLIMFHVNEKLANMEWNETLLTFVSVEYQKEKIASNLNELIEFKDQLTEEQRDPMSYENVSSYPLLVNQPTLGNYEERVDPNENKTSSFAPIVYVPLYTPSESITLPALPSILIPHTAEGRVQARGEKRMDYTSFQNATRGPTYDSCWVIPDRLAMGSIPWAAFDESCSDYSRVLSNEKVKPGSTSKDSNVSSSSNDHNILENSQGDVSEPTYRPNVFVAKKFKPKKVSTVSTLLLSGIDSFVSLLEPEEESKILQAVLCEPMNEKVQKDFHSVQETVYQIVRENEEIIRKQRNRMSKIPRFGKTDPRYAVAYREMLRCKARIRLAEDAINKAKSQVRSLKASAEWSRIALPIDYAPDINQLLPHVWYLERLLKQGKCLYVYSNDGHGRAGMICAILIGRLYQISPYECLYRIQACHDCSRRELHRKFPVNCPQLPIQKKLVSDVLKLSFRILDGNKVRYVENEREMRLKPSPNAISLLVNTKNSYEDQKSEEENSIQSQKRSANQSTSEKVTGSSPTQEKALLPTNSPLAKRFDPTARPRLPLIRMHQNPATF